MATILTVASAALIAACTPGAGATVAPPASSPPAASAPASRVPESPAPSGSAAGKGSY